MFYHRQKELKEINDLLMNKNKSILIYGKRRVGKTELIKECFKDHNSIYFECVRDTLKNNIELFVEEIKEHGIEVPPYISFANFIQVFQFLNGLGEIIDIAIDEYPYLYSFADTQTVDSSFQNIIDNNLSNLNIIISGSEIQVMENLLIEGNPLYGRFNATIHLKDFDYIESSSFYDELSPYDKVSFYSVFGGSPFVNKSIRKDLSLKDNIIATFLTEGNEVYNYVENVLITDAANKIQARRILAELANSKKRYSDLIKQLDPEKTGVITRSLNSLMRIGLIRKVTPINYINDAKKTYYEIADNPLRFFYTYVYKRKSQLNMIGAENFYNQFIEPSLITFISYRFKDICRTFVSLLAKQGKICNISNIGTYYYDDPKNQKNGEFDLAIQTRNGFDIIEVKYTKEKVDAKTINKEIRQIKQIPLININKYGFISINGYQNDIPKMKYLYDGNDIYSID